MRLDYRTTDWDPAFLAFLREKDAEKKVCYWNAYVLCVCVCVCVLRCVLWW